jgi:hypothetical protein
MSQINEKTVINQKLQSLNLNKKLSLQIIMNIQSEATWKQNYFSQSFILFKFFNNLIQGAISPAQYHRICRNRWRKLTQFYDY